MPTNPNMVAIQTVTVGSGGASSITFSNIPQTYTDLVIYFSGRSNDIRANGGFACKLEFNNSTTNLSSRWLRGSGSAVNSSTETIIAQIASAASDDTSNTFGNSFIYIPNYTSSNNKSVSIDGVEETNGTTAYAILSAGLWSNSAAITSIKILPIVATQFTQYSSATLYGVTNYANNQTGAYATGGTITTDGQYWYHTFTSSSTFTPSKNLSCDVLVIAGGGGGGSRQGGGGGAGGLQAFTSQALTATNYTVTVGGGGTGSTNGAGANGSNGTNSQFGALTASVGGGGGGGENLNGSNGGSGGGSGQGVSKTGGTATSGQGFAGGNSGNSLGSSGGGGAGEAGDTDGKQRGGDGTSVYSSWGIATATGQNISGTFWYAGGGSGGYGSTPGSDGGGGAGGAGDPSGSVGIAGLANMGAGGGGGGASAGTGFAGGNGGSGIIIVRYSVNS